MTMRILSFLALSFIVLSCADSTAKKEENNSSRNEIHGETQGTTYSIVYYHPYNSQQLKFLVDSVLIDFDNSLSTWVSTSLISSLNNADTTHIVFEDHVGYFTNVFKYSREVYLATDGLFDPTIAPLSLAWGFGFKNRESITPQLIDSLLPLVGFDYESIRLTSLLEADKNDAVRSLFKKDKGIQLDFNAIAQGYSVDVLADYLESLGINSYMLEIGGELKVKWRKEDGSKWRLGVDVPEENASERKLQTILELEDEAVATSGNYRKFYEINGKKYAHTLNPKTGYPVEHTLLSATVVAKEAWKADAYATALMVMGIEKAIEFIENNPQLGLEVYLIYDQEGEFKTYVSKGLESKIAV